MPKRGENIRKRKDGRWEARYIESYKIDGAAKYKSLYAPSCKEVKEKLEAQKLKPWQSDTTINISRKLTIEQLCTEWLEDVRISLKAPSYARYYNMIHTHIIPAFSKRL